MSNRLLALSLVLVSVSASAVAHAEERTHEEKILAKSTSTREMKAWMKSTGKRDLFYGQLVKEHVKGLGLATPFAAAAKVALDVGTATNHPVAGAVAGAITLGTGARLVSRFATKSARTTLAEDGVREGTLSRSLAQKWVEDGVLHEAAAFEAP